MGRPLGDPIAGPAPLPLGAFGAGGASALLTWRSFRVERWRPGQPNRDWGFDGGPVAVAVNPAGDQVLVCTPGGEVRLHREATGEVIWTIGLHLPVPFVHFSPDGRRFVMVGGDGTVRICDAATGQAVSPPLRHGGPVRAALFSPDSQRVATSGQDETARVWDAVTGEPLTPPLTHFLRNNPARFSPDGYRVVTADRSGRVWFWDAATGESLGPPLAHGAWIDHAVFSPDGRRLATSDIERVVRVWELPRDDRPAADLAVIAQLLSASRFDARGGLVRLGPEEIKAAWLALRTKYPDEFGPTKPSAATP